MPGLVYGIAAPVRDHGTSPPGQTEDNPLGVYQLGPEHTRRRTLEEVEGLRLVYERERADTTGRSTTC